MGKIDEKIKNKRCAINVRINPEMKDKFTAKVKSENRKINDVIREYIEYYTLGYNPKPEVKEKLNMAKRFRLNESESRAFEKACSDMSLNQSSLVRSLVTNWLKVNGYEVDKK